MADGVVQVPPDNLGKKIDVSELTRDDGTVVERQRITIGDEATPGNMANVTSNGHLQTNDPSVYELLWLILVELRTQTILIQQMNNPAFDDPAALRSDVRMVGIGDMT